MFIFCFSRMFPWMSHEDRMALIATCTRDAFHYQELPFSLIPKE